MPTLSDLLTSNTENRPQLLAAVTPKPKDATSRTRSKPARPPPPWRRLERQSGGSAAVLRAHAWRTPLSGQQSAPLPTLTTLRSRPGSARPARFHEHALDHG